MMCKRQLILCLDYFSSAFSFSSSFPPISFLVCVPQHENKDTWLGSSIGPMMRSYLQLRTFWRMRTSIQRESKRCNTDGRSVWTAAEETLLKKRQNFRQIRPLHHST